MDTIATEQYDLRFALVRTSVKPATTTANGQLAATDRPTDCPTRNFHTSSFLSGDDTFHDPRLPPILPPSCYLLTPTTSGITPLLLTRHHDRSQNPIESHLSNTFLNPIPITLTKPPH